MTKTDQKHNLLWGGVLIYFGAVALIDSFFNLSPWIWVGVLLIAGLFPAIVFWPERQQWAYFIPTYVFWAIASLLIVVLANIIPGEAIATYVLAAIGVPFIIGYLRDRKNWGLLIPAYVLFVIGIMVGLIGLGWLVNFLIPAYVMFAIAIPFFTVYVLNAKNWWALIPAGIMSVIGLGFLLATPAARLIVPLALVGVGIWIIIQQVIKK